MALSDWHGGWDIDGSLASLEDALGVLPGHYERTVTTQTLAVPVPGGGTRDVPVETVLNPLAGTLWRIATAQVAPGQHVLYTQIDQSDAARRTLEALLARRYQHPELATIRKRAIKQLIEAVTAIAARHGHARDGQQWVRDTAWCHSAVRLQRGRGGFGCYLNVEYCPRLIKWDYPANATRVGMFAPRRHQIGGTDTLFYVDIDGPTPLRNLMLDLLGNRVMPYLDRCHSMLDVKARTHKPFGMMPI